VRLFPDPLRCISGRKRPATKSQTKCWRFRRPRKRTYTYKARVVGSTGRLRAFQGSGRGTGTPPCAPSVGDVRRAREVKTRLLAGLIPSVLDKTPRWVRPIGPCNRHRRPDYQASGDRVFIMGRIRDSRRLAMLRVKLHRRTGAKRCVGSGGACRPVC